MISVSMDVRNSEEERAERGDRENENSKSCMCHNYIKSFKMYLDVYIANKCVHLVYVKLLIPIILV